MRYLVFAACVATFALSSAPAKADDASWGCQILLCAASQSPSWHGVPYCVPPMTKLIRDMSKSWFKWPICAEAGTAEPRYEKYEECPEDMIAISDDSENHSGAELSQCRKTLNQCLNRAEFLRKYGNEQKNAEKGIVITAFDDDDDDSSSSNACYVNITQPRPVRSEPYFFDIPNDKGVKERHWFNLNL